MSGDPSKPATIRFTMNPLIEAAYSQFVDETILSGARWSVIQGLQTEEWYDELARKQAKYRALPPDEKQRIATERQAAAKIAREVKAAGNKAAWMTVLDWCGRNDTLLESIAYLHEPDEADGCQGCASEVSGYEYDMDDWPCGTILLLQKAAQA